MEWSLWAQAGKSYILSLLMLYTRYLSLCHIPAETLAVFLHSQISHFSLWHINGSAVLGLYLHQPVGSMEDV